MNTELNKKVAALMGVNLKPVTDEQIASVVMRGFSSLWGNGTADFESNGHRHERLSLVYSDVKTMNTGYGWTLWKERDGKPYQADLEAHVASFEFPPPDYSGDANEALKVIEFLRPDWTWICFDGGAAGVGLRFTQRQGDGNHLAYGDTFAESVCLAAIRTVKGEKL
jgi:hypothetical protein